MSVLASHFDASAVLFDTLIWTAALIALVLVLRRPVMRWLGAPAAYSLWLLPMLRLVLPPIELPAWAAPAKDAAPEAVETVSDPIVIEIGGAAAAAPSANPVPNPATVPTVKEPADVLTTLGEALASLPLTELALAAWLGGAGVFLYRRFSAYFHLRAELKQDAVEVGQTKGPLGTIRLIETPGTNAPLAFGVLDPVIALPQGFMASPDQAAREARDLALAHELEHHKGHDLLINVLAQPLFALHWFNPLGRYGWLALRRDQEAACDARVMASASKKDRAIYANVIASFAAGPNVAPEGSLVAPMACPVLGDKSIIHRLRNLKMNDESSNTKSRKLATRLMLGTAVLALPLTASVTYAESLAPEPAALAAPAAPTPPIAPVVTALAQATPEAPEAAEAPEVEVEEEVTIITVDPDTGETTTMDIKGDAKKLKTIKLKGNKVMVLREGEGEEVDMAEIVARYGDKDVDFEELVKRFEDEDGRIKIVTKRFADIDGDFDDLEKLEKREIRRQIEIIRRENRLEEGEIEVIIEEMRESLAEAREAAEEARIQIKEMAESEEWKAALKEGQSRTIVTMSCDSSSDDITSTVEREDGRTEVMICEKRVMAQALKGLEQARAAIARNSEMGDEMRREILKELDQQIDNWGKDAR